MRETQIVERIRKLAKTGPLDSGVVEGIGDDCAILRPTAREDLVFTTDFLLENRHFTRKTHSPRDVGHKALARSLSDLAAMGAEPVFCLVSLAIPSDLSGAWLDRFYRGLLSLAKKHNCTLAGGDLSQFDRIVVDVMCCGRVPREKALLRSAAKPGDAIYVTGKLGKGWQKNVRPEPRMEAGLALRRLGVKAAIDLSDGLSLDLHRLCVASKSGAEIGKNLPLARGATLEQALNAGEDYELLFTASPRRRIPAKIGNVRIRRIGVMTKDTAGRVLLEGRALEPRGFDHFSTRAF